MMNSANVYVKLTQMCLLSLIVSLLTAIEGVEGEDVLGHVTYQCNEAVKCMQAMNNQAVGCSKNSMNTAIVNAVEYMGCYTWQTETRDTAVVLEGGQVLFTNMTALDVFDDNLSEVNNWLVQATDAELEELVIVNWAGVRDSSLLLSSGSSNDTILGPFDANPNAHLISKRNQKDLEKLCSLISASKNGAFTNGATVKSEFCIALGQKVAELACYGLVTAYFDQMNGNCKN